jgi:hypothetical protein
MRTFLTIGSLGCEFTGQNDAEGLLLNRLCIADQLHGWSSASAVPCSIIRHSVSTLKARLEGRDVSGEMADYLRP